MFIELSVVNDVHDKNKDSKLKVNPFTIALIVPGLDHSRIVLTIPLNYYTQESNVTKAVGVMHPNQLVVRDIYADIHKQILANCGPVANLLYSKE